MFLHLNHLKNEKLKDARFEKVVNFLKWRLYFELLKKVYEIQNYIVNENKKGDRNKRAT